MPRGADPNSWRQIAIRMMNEDALERDIIVALVRAGAEHRKAVQTLATVRPYAAGPGTKDNSRVKRIENAKAGIYHLVDLKRAGHSPRRTELTIPTDLDRPRHYIQRTDYHSSYGSPAASCAEMGEAGRW